MISRVYADVVASVQIVLLPASHEVGAPTSPSAAAVFGRGRRLLPPSCRARRSPPGVGVPVARRCGASGRRRGRRRRRRTESMRLGTPRRAARGPFDRRFRVGDGDGGARWLDHGLSKAWVEL